MSPPDNSIDAKGILPPDPLLGLDKYLAMVRALGDQTNLNIVVTLSNSELTDDELAESLAASKEDLAPSLSELVDVGLIAKRARNDGSSIHRYYRCTIFAEVLLQDGIQELFTREWEMRDAYNGSE